MYLNKKVLSWALYDWANSAFATSVMAAFFPLFYKQYWASELSASDSTFYLSLSLAIGGISLAILAPFLGTVADAAKSKSRFLFSFTVIGALSTCCMYFIAQGQWIAALLLYLVASLCFSGANIFYDALLIEVSDRKHYDRVSAFGFSLGYLGGGVLLVINVLMFLKPESFGISSGEQAVKWSFVSVGLWWFLFAIPAFRIKPAKNINHKSLKILFQTAWKDVFQTIQKVIQHKALLYFLIGYMFYIDGVHTVIKMAVDFGMSLGLDTQDMIKALVVVQFVGFPAALVFGYLGEKWSPFKALLLGIIVYMGVIVYAHNIQTSSDFFILASVIGCIQGGVQSLSRSLFARFVPKQNSGEFFGLYNMLGKFSSFLGPSLIAITSFIFQDNRISILSLLVLFVAGMVFLIKSFKAYVPHSD